jgi:hypothetical protein
MKSRLTKRELRAAKERHRRKREEAQVVGTKLTDIDHVMLATALAFHIRPRRRYQ